MLQDSLLEITPRMLVQHSDGETLGGVSLKALKFESEEERLTRRDNDKKIEKKIIDLKLEATRLDVESSEAKEMRNINTYTIGKWLRKVNNEIEKLRGTLLFRKICHSS